MSKWDHKGSIDVFQKRPEDNSGAVIFWIVFAFFVLAALGSCS